jgi:hypothetical protein
VSLMVAPDEIALPYRTDWPQMRGVLDYCKGKGADRSALEARFGAGEGLRETLNALEQLRLIERNDAGDVRLTRLGEQIAYAPDGAQLRARLVEALVGYPPYRYPLERAAADRMEVLDAPWVEHIWQVDMRLGQPRNRVEEARTFFFRLADEAGLGVYRRGVRGQTTRLDLAEDAADRLMPLLRRSSLSTPTEPAAAEDDQPAVNTIPADLDRAAGAVSFPAPQLTIAPVPAPASATTGVTSFTIHVDMSGWEIERIDAFLRLIGYLPR